MRDLIGMKFGRLIVIGQAERKLKRKVRWECKCDCGKMKVINSTDLTKTKSPTRSCGCIQKERTSAARLTHGNNSSNSAEYRAWTNIKTRCYNPKSGVGNKTYMAKGIKMCERWINSFEIFLSDMGHRPSNKHSIDRFPDRNGNYEPSNCRWATLSEQARNKDRSVLFEVGGMSLILQDWADLFGVDQANLMLSIRMKGIEKVYDYYFKKYNGVFPNNRVHKHKTENYNIPKPIIAYREGMTIILEGKSIREISKLTECHHSRVEKFVNTKLPYRSWFFEYLLQ